MRKMLGANDRGALMAWGLQNPEAWWNGSCVERNHEACFCAFCMLTAEKRAA
jgi:hypothetical protein